MADELTFEKDIRPIFREYCFDCHGASEEIEGGLDLRLVRLMIEGGDSGAAIIPEHAHKSLLLERIQSGEMPPGEAKLPKEYVSKLEAWIQAGAKTARPEPTELGVGLGITQEERSYWAFQPIAEPSIPTVKGFGELDALDALVLADMLEDERVFEPEARRSVLVKRLYFDLIGLPPSMEEMKRWAQSTDQNWFGQLLTELMASPHYGERWARHWLDVAGYADSEGSSVKDAERPWAYKYRDWVIRSFNKDKPFDQFVTEQLAGDEIAGPKQGEYTHEQIELLTATGFLRMAADGTGSGGNNEEGRNQVMIDTIKIVGSSLFGLSIHCAQCHDHRYDPIPQTDYYALRAVFEPALDWKAWRAPNARLVSLYTAKDHQLAAEVEVKAKAAEQTRKQKQDEYMKQAVDAELKKFEEPLRTKLRHAYETSAKERSKEQAKLLSENPSVNITTGNLYQYIPESRPKLDEMNKVIAKIRSEKPVHEYIRALVEPENHQPQTKLFFRGDFAQPKQVIQPAKLSVVSSGRLEFDSNNDKLSSTGRRLAFARWLTSSENPLFARAMVNRIWMHHFGQGLVPTPGEFGELGALPSNLALLDFLALEFRQSGFSLKHLHQLILSSKTWRQSISPQSKNPYARHFRRLEAEILRDRMLSASGSLNADLFGKPQKIKEDETGQVVVDGEQNRRSIYVQVRRSQPVALMQAFDAPVMDTNCESRVNSTVATQSLMLLNGGFILKQAELLAARVVAEAETLPAGSFEYRAELPDRRTGKWQYGYGWLEDSKDSPDGKALRTKDFVHLPHFDGSRWCGGPKIPDPELSYALLTSTGGHPGIPKHAVIRRWTVPSSGKLRVTGKLNHPSENGDGVRATLVSDRQGKVGQWTAKQQQLDTTSTIEVESGETLDFVVDCREHHTSDSFSWTVSLRLDGDQKTWSSQGQFAGPAPSLEDLPGQIVRAWELAYCRRPDASEFNLAMDYLAQQITTLNTHPEKVPDKRSAQQQALINLCQSLLSSNEFLYVE